MRWASMQSHSFSSLIHARGRGSSSQRAFLQHAACLSSPPISKHAKGSSLALVPHRPRRIPKRRHRGSQRCAEPKVAVRLWICAKRQALMALEAWAPHAVGITARHKTCRCRVYCTVSALAFQRPYSADGQSIGIFDFDWSRAAAHGVERRHDTKSVQQCARGVFVRQLL